MVKPKMILKAHHSVFDKMQKLLVKTKQTTIVFTKCDRMNIK